jgi:GNAT superfamily N-acetyltransferase
MIIRPAVPGDERALFELIRALARFERLEDTVTGSAEALGRHLFGERPAAEALIAEDGGVAVGFALFFPTYSTFLTRPGVYLEDLFVLESHRRRGIGGALLAEVKRVAEARGAGRLEWSVLDWNAGAIAFYERFGATVLPQWRICRVTFDRG